MKKICQINVVYGVGSTGKLTRDIHHSLLAQGYQSTVIVPQKSQFTNEDGIHVVSNKCLGYCSAILRRTLGMQHDWGYIQTHRIIHILKKEKPDVVHLQCINGNDINIYKLLRYLSKNKIKTVYTLHAEFPYTGGCGHAYDCEKWKTGCGNCPILKEATQSPWIDGTHRTWKKLFEAYKQFDNNLLHFTAVSPWLANRAECAPLLNGFKKTVVMNGVDTSIFNYKKTEGIWRKQLHIDDKEQFIFYATASFFPYQQNLKGGRFIIELAKRLEGEPIKIVVAANYGDGSNLPGNVIYIGRTKSQQDLAELYKEANLTIITSRRETFSMPVAESLCCGTPIVGFKAGGPESIALKGYCEFVEYGDINLLRSVVRKFLNGSYNKEQISDEAKRLYSKEIMTLNYTLQYQ